MTEERMERGEGEETRMEAHFDQGVTEQRGIDDSEAVETKLNQKNSLLWLKFSSVPYRAK